MMKTRSKSKSSSGSSKFDPHKLWLGVGIVIIVAAIAFIITTNSGTFYGKAAGDSCFMEGSISCQSTGSSAQCQGGVWVETACPTNQKCNPVTFQCEDLSCTPGNTWCTSADEFIECIWWEGYDDGIPSNLVGAPIYDCRQGQLCPQNCLEDAGGCPSYPCITPEPQACTSSDTCPADWNCIDSLCVDTCTTNFDCGENERCESSSCVSTVVVLDSCHGQDWEGWIPGTKYILEGDISAATVDVCFAPSSQYAAPRYEIDCKNKKIRGDGNNVGITLDRTRNAEQITIKNCILEDFKDGIVVRSSDNIIYNNQITDTSRYGLEISGYRNLVVNNYIENTGDGTGNGLALWISGGESNTIESNTISNNQDGGVFVNFQSIGNTFTSNTACNNRLSDFSCGDGSGFLGNENTFGTVASCADNWPLLDTNYDTCLQGAVGLTECHDQSWEGWAHGTSYYLENDLEAVVYSSCLRSQKREVGIDCRGLSITSTSGGTGIILDGTDSHVMNCDISGFNTGVFVSSDRAQLINNDISSVQTGIFLSNSDDTYISGVIACVPSSVTCIQSTAIGTGNTFTVGTVCSDTWPTPSDYDECSTAEPIIYDIVGFWEHPINNFADDNQVVEFVQEGEIWNGYLRAVGSTGLTVDTKVFQDLITSTANTYNGQLWKDGAWMNVGMFLYEDTLSWNGPGLNYAESWTRLPCFDSDGNDVNVIGDTYGQSTADAEFQDFVDHCATSMTDIAFVPRSNFVRERTCAEGLVVSTTTACADGLSCVSGACVSEAPVILGDVDGDTEINEQDAILLAEAYVTSLIDGTDLPVGYDINCDGIADQADAIKIAEDYVNSLISGDAITYTCSGG
jgi:parallel beta-helix repeat protein